MRATVLRKFLVGTAQVIGALAVTGSYIGLVLAGLHPKWPQFGVFTLFIFGVPLWYSRGLWHRSAFWSCLALLFLLHCAVYVYILLNVEEFALLNYLLLAPLEMAGVSLVVDKVAGRHLK